jgi:type I restriction enzyme S subunit
MNKATKKLVPELRFPEFVKDGEWVEKKLGELGQFIGGGTPDRSNSDYWIGDIPWISSSDICENDIHNISTTRFINENAIKQSATKIIPKGSVLFISRVGVGKLAINKDELCTSQDFTSFLPATVQNYFIAYYFSANKQLLQSLNQGTSIKGFSKNDLENFELIYPKSPQEQQKIASCLSSLDEVIAAHSQKLEALKTHKKGLMQNLFPNCLNYDSYDGMITMINEDTLKKKSFHQINQKNQGSDNVPKYRFKEFADDGEWVEKMLESFCLNLSSGKDKNTMDGEYELYGSTGIIGRTDNASYDGDFILIARVGANAGLLNRAKGKFGVTDNTLVIDLKESEYIDFVFYSLERFGLNKLVFGSGQPLITGGQLKSLNMKIPKSEKEQQKIAECLFSLDALITAQAKKIEQLKLHKKGLMQGLFPGMSEL